MTDDQSQNPPQNLPLPPQNLSAVTQQQTMAASPQNALTQPAPTQQPAAPAEPEPPADEPGAFVPAVFSHRTYMPEVLARRNSRVRASLSTPRAAAAPVKSKYREEMAARLGGHGFEK